MAWMKKFLKKLGFGNLFSSSRFHQSNSDRILMIAILFLSLISGFTTFYGVKSLLGDAGPTMSYGFAFLITAAVQIYLVRYVIEIFSPNPKAIKFLILRESHPVMITL